MARFVLKRRFIRRRKLWLPPSSTGIVTAVGAAAGTGAASGVGAALGIGDGAAAGTGAVSGVGNANFLGDGAAAGSGSASAAGIAAAAADGAAAGSGTSSGAGLATAISDGAAAGTGSASGTGLSSALSDGAAAGTGAASGAGLASASADGAAAGTGTASGTGAALGIGDGAASGTGTAAATGAGIEFVYVRPDADTTTGTWTNHLGGAELYSAIDESAADDADYIQSAEAPALDLCKIAVGNPAGTPTAPVVMSYRFQKSAPTGTMELRVRLLQGATEVAAWTEADISDALVTRDRELSAGEIAAISDWNDLHFEFRANYAA